MVLETAATFLGGWALALGKQKVGQALLQGLDQRLNPSDLERFLGRAIAQSNQAEPELFHCCQRDGPEGSERFLSKFFKGRALAELQKPLQNQGKPDDALLAKAFLREAESHSALGDIDPRLVEAWMRAFTEAYFQTTNNFLNYQVTKEQYYSQLRAKIGKVVFSGIAVDRDMIDAPGDLTEIFVMPDVQRQKSKDYELAETPLPENVDEHKLNQQKQQQPISATELLKLKSGQRVVLLGAPGSGKTTLVNYLVAANTLKQARENPSIDISALSADQYFPILIRIRDLVGVKLSVLDFLEQFAKTELEIDSVPTGFFQYWLKNGQAFILLDGLDEVSDDTQRDNVVKKIETFLRTCDDRCPVIITSRPAGNRDDYFSRAKYRHYELLPFDDEKIETFINKWYESRVNSEVKRESLKRSLRKALSDKPRIKQLARNPLLLTIIALIHGHKTLPKQRHDLYRDAVETLISRWDKGKELTTQLKYLNTGDIQRLMKQLAYWIHNQGSVDEAENGTEIKRDDLIRKLSEFIQEIKASENLQPYQAKAEAKDFLDKIIADRSGLLSQQGKNRYAFVHKTFQEYLCSQEIFDLEEVQVRDDGDYVPHDKNPIQKHLHDPYWREVLLLLVAQQSSGLAEASLKIILKADSDYEQWLHRDLLLAGSCLAENSEVTNEATIDEILTKLVNLEICSQPTVSEKLHNEIFRVICSLQGTFFAPKAIRLLEKHQQSVKHFRFIGYQSELEPDKSVQRLLLLLKDDDKDVRSHADASLRQIGHTSDAVVEGLLAILQDATANRNNARLRAAMMLGEFGHASDKVGIPLLMVLKDTAADTNMRFQAAESLLQLGYASDDVVEVLLAMLKDDPIDRLRFVEIRVFSSLSHLSYVSDNVISTLLMVLRNANVNISSGSRSQVIKLLGQLGNNSSEAVVSTLLEVLQDADASSDMRFESAVSLEKLGHACDEVINTLLAALQDSDNPPDVCFQAIQLLIRLGNSSDEVLDELLVLFLKSQGTAGSSYMHHQTAALLGKLSHASDEVSDKLLELLQDIEAPLDMRFLAAASLGQLGNNSKEVVDVLLAMLRDIRPSSSEMRLRAAELLGRKDSGGM